MCMSSTPPPSRAPAPPAAPPSYVDRDITEAGDLEKRRQRAAAGRSGTILTGPGGLGSSSGNTGKTILGG